MIFASENIFLESPSFKTGKGGKGGNGGKGGKGGLYGFGGSAGTYGGKGEQDDGGCGGWGGDGGIGGDGGGGGGGPTVCVVYSSDSTLYNSTSMKCVKGTPGNGGSSNANPGETGYSANTLGFVL